mmetsp:Transcript_8301/g.23895  ORF Transcript_8301/g.23895 Transcript_8301/m.23895 type:complete len:343 (-) Transcript_8301:1-1029(-)
MDKVLGDDGLIGVSENALERTVGSLLQDGLDVVAGARLLGAEGQVDHGNVWCWDPNSHSGQLAVELGDDLSDGLGGAGGGRDEIVQGGTAGTPVLASLGGAVHDELVGGSGVDGGHKTLDDSELVVEDLCQRCQAVGGARGVAQDGGAAVLRVVDAHHVHGGVVLGRGGDDDALGASLQVGLGLLLGGEDAGGLADGLGTDAAPRDVGRVALGEELDAGGADHEAVTVDLDFFWVHSVHGVVLELVRGVLDGEERIVDAHDGGVGVVKSGAHDETADASKSVDSEVGWHDCWCFVLCLLCLLFVWAVREICTICVFMRETKKDMVCCLFVVVVGFHLVAVAR